jgi:CrcB protein
MTLVARLCGEAFPWGTLFVNALGSFLLGFVLGAGFAPSETGLSGSGAYFFAAIGFCGGLTTFSTFSLQTLTLVSQKQWRRVAANVFGGLALCLLCLLSGYAIAEGVMA